MIVAAVAATLWLGAAGAQAPSAAPPSPSSAAPVQQTPLSTSPNTATPAQNPSAAPMQSPGVMGTPRPMGSTTLQNPNVSGSPIQMPSVLPSRAETAPSAFDKLASSGSTFVTKDETDRLDGFDRAFSEADRDRDGKLTKDEFNVAWAIYTGRT
jgi:hypothetical protein